MEDKQIVELYWRRDEQAIGLTRQKYGHYCHSIAYNILENSEDAQECVNDTYLAAWNTIPPHRPQILSTFLGKLTRRICLDRRRTQHAAKRGGDTVTLSLEELAGCIPNGRSFIDTLEERELARLISSFLRKIPQCDRQIFIRRYWYCDSIAQIAHDYSSGESRIKMKLLRTRNKLMEYLRKEGVISEKF